MLTCEKQGNGREDIGTTSVQTRSGVLPKFLFSCRDENFWLFSAIIAGLSVVLGTDAGERLGVSPPCIRAPRVRRSIAVSACAVHLGCLENSVEASGGCFDFKATQAPVEFKIAHGGLTPNCSPVWHDKKSSFPLRKLLEDLSEFAS